MNDQKMSLRLLLLALFCAGAIGLNAQTVTQSFNGEALKSVLKEVERQTGLSVIYKTDEVRENKKITETFTNASVTEVLSKVLDDNLEYKLQNKMIVISLKPVQQQQTAPVKKVTGTIVDGSGEPVIGASILVKGTANIGTITDMNGEFVLNAPADAVLTISYIGFKAQNVPVTGKNTLYVKLQEDAEALDEVVVVGYGTQKKSSLTASVASIAPQDI